MTHKRYGELMALMWSAISGGYGMWGILVGITQGRIGPIILGAIFIWAAILINKLFLEAAKKWEGRE